MQMYGHFEGFALHTVDGRNPAPPDMYETVQTMAYLPYQLVNAGFLPSTLEPCLG